ncbi:GH1 family beta-glucosidase [Paracoccus tegillarcae]|uniref:Beta-glucosidase n=1 Tax=Paracoccus tegillarcae TaxID=1529068 RepID=A0A2K9EIY0_9RHOB|nr:GH1 family beta-glucosidase [Paracoccus tegillarcae]AUH34958.1 beta-glucosidase [Paracoccus tegillarcae]
MIPKRSSFPPGFIFGAATSAYQIEGARFGGAGTSHWDSFAATPGNTHLAQDGARACEHYLHWESDLDLMQQAGFDAYRFSTSWARVMPDGKTVNAEGLDFYDRLVDGMVARGLKPFLTFHHWDMPSALATRGGWQNREIVDRFAEFCRSVYARVGDRVETAATLNEPWCISWLSHFMGAHAPGLRDIRATGHAMHHVMLAHGTAIQALRADGARDHLGLVLNFETAHPADDSPEATAAAVRQDAIYNRWFVQAAMGQGYPAEALEGLEPHLPKGWQDDLATIATPMDWLGVNHYTRKNYAHDDGPWPHSAEVAGPLPKTQIDWEIRPEGLTEFLLRLKRDHTGDLPLYVTESGVAFADEFDDPKRIDYIAAHLRAAQAAIEQGVDLRSFFYWSLLDNYEWSLGYVPRFGLIHVDYDTMQRTPKASYHALREALSG